MEPGSDELVDAVRAARKRMIHLLLIGASLIALVTLEIVVHVSARWDDLIKLVLWFAGCAGFALIGRAFYRHRLRSEAKLFEAIQGNVPIKRVEVTRLLINHVIPFGYDVDIVVADGKNVPMHLAFGVWTRVSAERIAGAVRNAAPALSTTRAPLPRATAIAVKSAAADVVKP